MWSYNGDMDSTRDRVRLEIGDTDSSNPRLADEVIDFSLVSFSDNVESAAVKCLDYLIAKAAPHVSYSVDGLSVQQGDEMERYKSLRESLLARIAGDFELWPGHTSNAEVELMEADTDRPAFAFNRHLFEGTNTGS